jgi:SAM-dependent methyltransferase
MHQLRTGDVILPNQRDFISTTERKSTVTASLQKIPTDSKECTEASVYDRYAAASKQVEPALCCPVQYAGQYLKVVPQEIIEKDYGCGDPSAWVKEGDIVLDLGSGAGKLCYIMSQVVGPTGKVIGVDCNTEMLALSRKYRAEVAGKIGYSNVEFRYGMIQDLQLDLDLLNTSLAEKPVQSSSDWIEGNAH